MFQTIPERSLGFHIQKRDGINNSITEQVDVDFVSTKGFDLKTLSPDMEFFQNFTPPDFRAKNFTPSISPNFNSVSGKNTKNE